MVLVWCGTDAHLWHLENLVENLVRQVLEKIHVRLLHAITEILSADRDATGKTPGPSRDSGRSAERDVDQDTVGPEHRSSTLGSVETNDFASRRSVSGHAVGFWVVCACSVCPEHAMPIGM